MSTENTPVINVGDTVTWINDFQEVREGNYRGVLEGLACVVVSGQNWFIEYSKLTKKVG